MRLYLSHLRFNIYVYAMSAKFYEPNKCVLNNVTEDSVGRCPILPVPKEEQQGDKVVRNVERLSDFRSIGPLNFPCRFKFNTSRSRN